MSELNKPIKPIGGGTLKKVRGEADHGVLQFGKVPRHVFCWNIVGSIHALGLL